MYIYSPIKVLQICTKGGVAYTYFYIGRSPDVYWRRGRIYIYSYRKVPQMFTEGGVAYTYIHRGRCPRCLLEEGSHIHIFTEEGAPDVYWRRGRIYIHSPRKVPQMFTEGGVAYTYIHRESCPKCLLREGSHIHTFTEEVATDVY